MSAIVDGHLHVWDETAFGKAPAPMKIGYSPQSVASVELFMDYMDEAGVEKAVFTQAGVYRWDNSYMTHCVERYPDRFRGVCIIDPRRPVDLYELRARGITGVRLRPPRDDEQPFPDGWLGAEETLPLWEAAAKTNTVVCVLWAGTDIVRLRDLLGSFPTVRVVVDQLNLKEPNIEGVHQPAFQALLAVADLTQVHVKISGFHHWCSDRYPYKEGMSLVEAAVRKFGAERCLWGSDFPHVLAACGYIRSRNILPRHATFLSQRELASVMGGTAEKLWFS